jgi:hypothetical protein
MAWKFMFICMLWHEFPHTYEDSSLALLISSSFLYHRVSRSLLHTYFCNGFAREIVFVMKFHKFFLNLQTHTDTSCTSAHQLSCSLIRFYFMAATLVVIAAHVVVVVINKQH